MGQKTVVHLHNGMLCSRKKEGTPTFYDSVVRNGDYYAKQSKPVGERQIPYDLTSKWKEPKKQNKQASKM